ncbi:MAG: hypothetical protein ACRDRA_16905, partial [Pseudonocardiaceae bacterium]
LRTFGSDLCRSGADEIRRALTGPWGYFRDGLVSQNRDWTVQANGAQKDIGARTRVLSSLSRSSSNGD